MSLISSFFLFEVILLVNQLRGRNWKQVVVVFFFLETCLFTIYLLFYEKYVRWVKLPLSRRRLLNSAGR